MSGAGVGLISPALAAAMVSVLPTERSGLGSGINNTFRQTGIAAGIAGLGAIFQRHDPDPAGFRSRIERRFPGSCGDSRARGGGRPALHSRSCLDCRLLARLSQVFVPRDREFFDLFEEAAGNIVRAAGLLKEMLADYPDKADLVREILICEQDGDRITHDIISGSTRRS